MTDQQHAPAGPGRPDPGPGGEPRAHEEPAATGDAAGVELPQRFRRDRRYKMLGGVCAGLGRQCDMDPVIFRVGLAVLSAVGGLGLIFYGFVWLLVPFEDEEENEVRKLMTGRVDGPALAAVLFALVGCGVFLSLLNNGTVLAFATVLSLLLAGAGYWSRRRGAPAPDPLAVQAAADAPPEATAPPVATAYPSWWRDPIVKDGTHEGGTGYLWGPSDVPDRDVRAAVNIAKGYPFRPGTPPAPRPRPRGPRRTGGRVFLLALLAGGLGTGLTWDDHPLGTSLQIGLSYALVVFGLGIALSAFTGRTGAGSVILAVITAALLAVSAALPKDIGTHWARTTWSPASAATVRKSYDLGTGEGTLDLSRIRPAEGRTVSADAEVGIGRLRIVLPPGVVARLDIDAGIGDIQLPGDTSKDVDVAPRKHTRVRLEPAAGEEKKNAGSFDLRLRVGAGQVEVIRAAS
ncbi:PspC domain-containing protein [Streptomyces sp. B3I8]|uniref:PspC domain-containing protein n=1 Tax=Streptomyces sp. B3I8 TaxID=3042303 RepID=UPI0027803381|nr:PspC domain-containing protein [Streptomyces sp. B3I8]MDQ0788693.1 phage shock protein PspC (stress-responsive transcriptional regulator) [Streptomyces sp. B3I8]